MRTFAILLPLLAACAPPAGGDPPQASGGESAASPAPGLIRFQAPPGWTAEEPSNNMRKFQYRVPDKEKKEKDAELAVTHSRVFIPLKDNLERWSGQMDGAEGKTETIQGKHKVTLADFTGPYEGDVSGRIADARMLVAILEADDGPWYFKLVGPAATVGDWRDEFIALLKSAVR